MTSKPRDLEALVKALEDEVFAIRENFERGLVARNTGSRVTELTRWQDVRLAATRASSLAADLVAEVVDR